MPEQDLEVGLIEPPPAAIVIYERASLCICFGVMVIFGVFLGGMIYMAKMFSEKICL
jgi:hypothetical protein